MEDLSSTPNQPEPDDLDRIDQGLIESLQATARALMQFRSYRDAVRGVVLASTDQPPLLIERAEEESKPRYDVDMRVRITVTVQADDIEEAAQHAMDLIQIQAGDTPLSVCDYDLDIVSVDSSDD